jgi:hypothetical protein
VESWISERIRSVSLRRLVVWTLVLAAGVFLAAVDRRYIANFVGGPYPLAAADLDSIQDIATTPHYYARVGSEKVLDTGLRQYTVRRRDGRETGREESAAYHAYVMGSHFLIVKTDGGAAPHSIEGRLAAWPSDLESQLFDTQEMRAMRSNFYPFYIDGDSFRRPGYIVIVVALLFLALFAWQALPAWRAWRNPDAHALARRIAGWGNPLAVAVEAEREFQHPHLRAGAWRLGDKYLVHASFFGFDLVRVHDVLWAYKKITKHSVNFIPTGKSYEAVVNCYGKNVTMPAKEKQVDGILDYLRAKAPWAAQGFSDELMQLWTKRQQEFIVAVEERRQEWQQQRTVG